MIRAATIEDLPGLEPLGRQFYAESRFLKNLDWPRFTELWGGLIGQGTGIILLLVEHAGIAGMLGGVTYPETYSGDLIATEFFWYVGAGHRGKGLKLYRAFEEWAREKGCVQIRMGHLADVMPEKLERVYKHLGFVLGEVVYVKELP